MARRHSNGQYRGSHGSPGDGTGFEIESVYECDQPEHALGIVDEDPPAVTAHGTQPFERMRKTPIVHEKSMHHPKSILKG